MGNRLWDLITTWSVSDIVAVIGAGMVIVGGTLAIDKETQDKRLAWSYAMWIVMSGFMGFFCFVAIRVVGSLLSLSVKDIAPVKDASLVSFLFSMLGYFLIRWIISEGLFFPEEWVTAHEKGVVFLPNPTGRYPKHDSVEGRRTLPTPEQYRFMAWVVDRFAFDFRQHTFPAACVVATEAWLWRWDIRGVRSTYPTPIFKTLSSVSNQRGGVEITHTFGNISAVYLTVRFETWAENVADDWGLATVSWSCHENPVRGGIRVYCALRAVQKIEDILGKGDSIIFTDFGGENCSSGIRFSNHAVMSIVVDIDTEKVCTQLLQVLRYPDRPVLPVSTERPMGNKPLAYQQKAQEAQALHDAKVAEIKAGPGTDREKRDRISALEEIREQTLDALKKKYLL